MILRKRGRNFLRVVKMKKDGVSFSMGKPLQSHILFRTAKAERVQQLTTKKLPHSHAAVLKLLFCCFEQQRHAENALRLLNAADTLHFFHHGFDAGQAHLGAL